MGKLTVFLDTVNSLTGRSKRHNRALRDIIDLSKTIQEFILRYHLQEKGPAFDFLFENIGLAKIELTTIIYQARTIVTTVKTVKGKNISPSLMEVHSDLEEVRRALIEPTVSRVLEKSAYKLCTSFKKLNDAISEIEYK